MSEIVEFMTLVNDKEIKYLGVENFSIFDSEQDMVILNDYYC